MNARPMTPRRAALPALVCATLVLVMASVVAQGDNETAPGTNTTAPAGNASAPTGGAPPAGASGIDYAVVILPNEAGGKFSWAIKELSFPADTRVQLTYDGTNAAAPHNLHVKGGSVDVATKCCIQEITGKESLAFTMPASGELTYVCDLHPEMTGKVTVAAFSVGGAAAGGEEGGIEHVGVHYLAYWVAVIAFAVLFIIYGLTFFLFKNGESNATTDHMDRPGASTGDASGNRLRAILVVSVTVLLVVGGLVLAFANMPAAG